VKAITPQSLSLSQIEEQESRKFSAQYTGFPLYGVWQPMADRPDNE